jgi:hypothetical protein
VHPDGPRLGLAARIAGVITSPRETYADVAAHPRFLGVLLATTIVAAAAQYGFLSSENGRKAALDAIDAQIGLAESLGATVTDEAYDGMLESVDRAPSWSAASILVASPIITLVLSAVLLGIFNGILNGEARFKQMFATVAHAGVVWTFGGVFVAALGFFTGRTRGTTSLSVFVPGLDTGLLAHLLGYIDLFWLWGLLSLATGLAVLYGRRTGPIATAFIALYLTVGVVYATVRSLLGV